MRLFARVRPNMDCQRAGLDESLATALVVTGMIPRARVGMVMPLPVRLPPKTLKKKETQVNNNV
jgi:hypothetical protein